MRNRYISLPGLAFLIVAAGGCGDEMFGPDASGNDVVDLDVTADDLPDAEDATDAGTDSGDVPHVTMLQMTPGGAYHEHALSEELGDEPVLNEDDTVLLWLEHPAATAMLNDTGLQSGTDRVEYRVFDEHVHTFCWKDQPEDAPHLMVLADQEGNEVMRLQEGEGCKTVTLEPGIYAKIFNHGGDGVDGELIFIQPELDQESPADEYAARCTARAPRAAGNPCVPIATLTHGTIGQLQAGQIGLTDTCSPTSSTTVWVFNQDCASMLDVQGAPAIQVAAVYTGPNTETIVYRGPRYSGYSRVATGTGGTPVCLNATQFVDDYWTSAKYSFKVWTNDINSTATSCMVKWVGRSDEIPWSAPAAGEAWLFATPGFPWTDNWHEVPGIQVIYVLNGPCYDLCRINGSETITYAKVGPNTVLTTYLDPAYLGQSFPYQGDVSTFGADNKLIESVYVESLAQYNEETTLIRTRNCNQCNLIGLRLIDGENLSGAQLVDANLTGARMIGVDLSNSDATRAVFRGANLAYANLKNAVLSNAVFEGDDHTRPANLSYAYMPDAKLDHTHLNGVTADYAQIYGGNATVLQATMVGIHLANSILCNMDFSQASMKGATLTGANLVSANFLGADLRDANLVNSNIQGARFDGAYLYGAQLQNASYAFNPGLMTVTRLGDNNTLQTVSVSYNATSLPPDTTNGDTYCPNGGQSNDGNAWCDSVAELTAPAPPSPPTCVPSATQFCPRPSR